MCKKSPYVVFLVLLAVPSLAFGSLIGITGFTPTGDHSGQVYISSITAGGTTYSTPLLEGAVQAGTTGTVNRNFSPGHPTYPSAKDCLIGLDIGSMAGQLGKQAANKIAAWFSIPITGDGDTSTAEVFLVEWGLSLDNYQIKLLTSDASAGIAGAVVAKTVQVRTTDQPTPTTTRINTTSGYQPLVGVGIDLDSEGLDPGTQILGVLVPSEDGLGGWTGLDPCVIAAIPEPCSLLLLLAAGALALARGSRSWHR
jgi:hypothetical protein